MPGLRTEAGPTTVCPECGAGLAPPTGSVSFAYGVGPVGYQGCGACGARWRYVWQSAPRRRLRRWPRALFGALAVVSATAAVAAGAFWVLTRNSTSYPPRWDVRVAPIAAQVERLRGLTFKHPVRVNYLSAALFAKRVTASPGDTKKERTQIEQTTGLLRAVGLIGANVDLVEAVNTTQAADTLAFYDDHTKQVYVRGVEMTVETRVTLAHELTHVLQDQYFDLPKLERRAEASKSGSSDAFTALIEGDATRIEDAYLGTQSSADRREYAQRSSQTSLQAQQSTRRVPAVVETYFSAPYIFGPQVIHVLDVAGGNSAINKALTGPTPSTRIYLDPTAVNDAPTIPPVPALQPGESKLTLSSNDDGFDAFTLYLMLAARLDRPNALLAADAYSSGSEALYRRSGATCFRAAIVAINPDGNTFLADELRQWTQTMPDAGMDSIKGPVVFHSCDPGRRATTPSDAHINEATALASGRDVLTATFVGLHLSNDIAACAARVLVEQPDISTALRRGDDLGKPDAQMLRESAAAGVVCRNNPLAGLPSARTTRSPSIPADALRFDDPNGRFSIWTAPSWHTDASAAPDESQWVVGGGTPFGAPTVVTILVGSAPAGLTVDQYMNDYVNGLTHGSNGGQPATPIRVISSRTVTLADGTRAGLVQTTTDYAAGSNQAELDLLAVKNHRVVQVQLTADEQGFAATVARVEPYMLTLEIQGAP